MALIVTGAAGFIGSNLVKALNERGAGDTGRPEVEEISTLAFCARGGIGMKPRDRRRAAPCCC